MLHAYKQTSILNYKDHNIIYTHTHHYYIIMSTAAYKHRVESLYYKILSIQNQKAGQQQQGQKSNNNINASTAYLKDLVEESLECVRLLPELDDGKISPEYQQVAMARAQKGLSHHEPPSELKAMAWAGLKMSRVLLAEQLEAESKYEEALAVYHELVTQAKTMRFEFWEPDFELHTMINNLGLCYKRNGQYEEAIEWYRKGIRMCQKEDPFSDTHKSLSINLHVLLDGNAGPLGTGVPDDVDGNNCWNCGARETEQVKLSFCSACKKDSRVEYPGRYCSVKCQKNDWPRHKRFHKGLKNSV